MRHKFVSIRVIFVTNACSLDPFGNYLCQKLLEYSTDEQRNMICESVAHDLVGISLNMHGTRAVQKMIDFLSTQRQVRRPFSL